jgi:hypothetical protein
MVFHLSIGDVINIEDDIILTVVARSRPDRFRDGVTRGEGARHSRTRQELRSN